MSKKRKWRIEVVQLSEERIPTRWQRFWGDRGEPYAWSGTVHRDGEVWTKSRTYGYTKKDAVDKARRHIADFEARENMESRSREVLYVEGS